MSEIDPVIFDFKARVDGYLADIRRTTAAVDQNIGRQENRIRSLDAEFQRSSGSIGRSLKVLAGTLATFFTGRELIGLLDSFTRLQNNLRVAGLEGDALAQVQGNLLGLSQKYGVELESLTGVFLKASLAQKELGASTEQIVQLNEIVAASLKVTGTSAEQAQGALLQLGQALGSGVVRAEEFNSILEGALPLAQAAARGIDGMGGSVVRLWAEIANGNVTSQEFFQGVLRGGAQTLEDAEKATLTLAGGVTALTSSLTVYFGQADKANGVSAALGLALGELAENLDTIIPALAAIATALGVGFATSAIRAQAAALSLTGALRGTLALLGGTAGIAITAVVLGLGQMVVANRNAEAAMLANARAAQDLGIELSAAEKAALAAANETAGIGADAATAEPKIWSFANAVDGLTESLYKQAKAARAARIELLAQKEDEATSRLTEARSNTTAGQVSLAQGGFGKIGQGDILGGLGDVGTAAIGRLNNFFRGGKPARQAESTIADAQAVRAAAVREIERLRNTPIGAADVPAAGGGATPAASGKKTAPKKGPRGETAEEAARRRAVAEARVDDEIARLGVDRLRSVAEITGLAEDRAAAEVAGLEADRKSFDRQVALDEQLTAAQRTDLTAARDAADAQRRRAIEIDRSAGLAREQLQREGAVNRLDQELTAARGAVNDRTAAERGMTELRQIDAQFSQRQDEAEQDYADAVKAGNTVAADIASAELERLTELRALAKEAARLRNLSPLDQLREELSQTRGQIAEDVQRVEVKALRGLEDGLVDAIRGAEDLGDVFSNVADQIIADLLRIAIQQTIIKPLADLLGGGGGLGGGIFGGIFSFLGGLFGGGKASGGRVEAGTLYRVNEGAGEGRSEFFRPDIGGQVIPLGNANAMLARGGNGPSGPVVVRLQLSGDIEARMVEKAVGVVVEFEQAVGEQRMRNTAAFTFNEAQRPRM